MSKTKFLLFFIFTHASWIGEVDRQDSFDEEDVIPSSDEVRIYRKLLDPSRVEWQRTGWVFSHLGHCVGVRQRLLWWFHKEVYVINAPNCEQIEQNYAGSLYMGKQKRLRCVVRHNPYTTITFGKRSSLLVINRLLECDQQWSTIGVREAMKFANDPLPPEEESQRQLLHHSWLRDFQTSATPLKNTWENPSCGTTILLKGILPNDEPKLSLQFKFATARFDTCEWKDGSILGETIDVETNARILTWTATENCGIEMRTHALSISDLRGKQDILASVLITYLVWANMLTDSVSLAQIMESISGNLNVARLFPPEMSVLLDKRIGSFSIITYANEKFDLSNSVLHLTDGRASGIRAQMTVGLPFLIYDPVCLKVWQSEGILIENDNPLHRVMAHQEYVLRIENYGESYIRAMLGYLMEIFLTMKDESSFYMKDPVNFRSHYNILPKVNWQADTKADSLKRKTLPEGIDYKLYSEGLKVFKREFAKEITDAGVEFGSNAWKDLTSHFRSPRAIDFFRVQQEHVKKHTSPPFLHNGHVYIVCQFRGSAFRGHMSGALNVLMMRGLSDASHFRPGHTYLYPDLLKLDRILERAYKLQNSHFDRQCRPIIHPNPEEEHQFGIYPFEIET